MAHCVSPRAVLRVQCSELRERSAFIAACARAVNESGPMIGLTIINLPLCIRRVGGDYRKDSEGTNGPPTDGQAGSDHTSDNI